MRSAILAVLAALSWAPAYPATLSRAVLAPVPVLRGPLAAPVLSAGISPVLLAAPLSAPGFSLSPSVALPQVLPLPAVTALAPVPALAPAPIAEAGLSLEHLASLAAPLSRLPADQAGPALDAFWTGQLALSVAAEASAPSYLAAPRGTDLVRLAGIVAAAQRSPTGAKVLRAVTALTKKEGRPIQVRFHDLKGNLGEYDYIKRVLYLDSKHAEGEPGLGAATLVHELLHILQHAEGVPAEALEMEIEAHVVTLMVLDELGIPASRDGSFSAAAVRELSKSPKAFEEWIAGQLPGKLRLNKGFAEAVEDLEAERDELDETVADLDEAYAESGTPQARGRLAKAQERLQAVQADLKALKSASGRAAYGKLAARARSLMARYHQALTRK